MLRIVGMTADNKIVVSGVFRAMETTGLSLADVLSVLGERAVVSWPHFLMEAAGLKLSKLLAMLKQDIADAYGPHYWMIVEPRLTALCV